jgi:serine protease Do
MRIKPLAVSLVPAAILVAGTASAVSWHPSEWFKAATPQAATVPAATDPVPVDATASPNYRAIVERFGPAVVGIDTERTVKTAAAALPDGLADDPFFRFFQGIPGLLGDDAGKEVPIRGEGSGFIVAKDGLILTNAHVVRNAGEVTVKLSDRREYKARVLGSDTATDVAVLKIDANNLPVVQVGDPARLGVGDYVLAIGSPFGFEQSATAGIVSAKGRSLPGDSYVPFIQTDVAVNPGNSGGPLFDAHGNVVGINSQIYSETGGYQGVSFAIPIDVALNVKEQIVSTGKVSHARLGVNAQEVNQALAESFRMKQPEGALVSSVLPGSAAAKAGLQSGDVILQYNDQPIVRAGDLSARVGAAKPGDKVTLEVWRAGKPVTIAAILGAADTVSADNRAARANAPQGKLGVAVRPLTPQERQGAQLAGGAVVEQVGGAAARAGIQPGDIIVAVNGRQVKGADDLRKMVEQEHKHVALLIQRGEDRIFVPVTLG